jgi:hypothetical protein
MKLMNELEAEVAGTIREICVENSRARRVRAGALPDRARRVSAELDGRHAAAAAPARAAEGEFRLRVALEEMVRRRASDLHLKVGRPPVLRVHGNLTETKHPGAPAGGRASAAPSRS